MPIMNDALVTDLRPTEGEAPAYRQIAERIAAKIRAGALPAGERLPPDRALAKALGLSRTTVVAAYDELKAAGLVHGRQGSGTYVARSLGPADNWTGPVDNGLPAALGRTGGARPLLLSHALPPVEGTPLRTLLRLLTEAAEVGDEAEVVSEEFDGRARLPRQLGQTFELWPLGENLPALFVEQR